MGRAGAQRPGRARPSQILVSLQEASRAASANCTSANRCSHVRSETGVSDRAGTASARKTDDNEAENSSEARRHAVRTLLRVWSVFLKGFSRACSGASAVLPASEIEFRKPRFADGTADLMSSELASRSRALVRVLVEAADPHAPAHPPPIENLSTGVYRVCGVVQIGGTRLEPKAPKPSFSTYGGSENDARLRAV